MVMSAGQLEGTAPMLYVPVRLKSALKGRTHDEMNAEMEVAAMLDAGMVAAGMVVAARRSVEMALRPEVAAHRVEAVLARLVAVVGPVERAKS